MEGNKRSTISLGATVGVSPHDEVQGLQESFQDKSQVLDSISYRSLCSQRSPQI